MLSAAEHSITRRALATSFRAGSPTLLGIDSLTAGQEGHVVDRGVIGEVSQRHRVALK